MSISLLSDIVYDYHRQYGVWPTALDVRRQLEQDIPAQDACLLIQRCTDPGQRFGWDKDWRITPRDEKADLVEPWP